MFFNITEMLTLSEGARLVNGSDRNRFRFEKFTIGLIGWGSIINNWLPDRKLKPSFLHISLSSISN